MHIQQVQIKNFRCFETLSLDFSEKIVYITGQNGSGKSSLLEALHYGCYLRSFRTHIPRELIRFNDESFFMKINIQHDYSEGALSHELQVGFSKKKRLVKIDQQAVTSYQELSRFYKVITLTEDDIFLIKGGPETRRLFLDQAIYLENPKFLIHLKRYKTILSNRNALLQHRNFSTETYMLWTRQLWQEAIIIQEYRRKKLISLENKTRSMLAAWFPEAISLSFSYIKKRMNSSQSFDDFCTTIDELRAGETIMKRSLFGSHLDDFSIGFCNQASRLFASRGQQKLIVMLIKIAQFQEIIDKNGSAVFLLDDFMTDFDQKRAEIILSLLLNLKNQLIFTCPLTIGYFEDFFQSQGAQHVSLSQI